MKAPLLVDALRARDPGAPAALYDTHGESLFRYCWFILRDQDAAQVTVRDTLVLAEAHIGRLRNPDMLGPWLYALARSQCLRQQQSAGAAQDAVPACPGDPDADRGLIAWHAVTSLGETEREALELTAAHGMDAGMAALVLDLAPAEAQQVIDRARAHLEQALAGEILTRRGVQDCPERAAAVADRAGELTAPLREHLIEHATGCEACRRYLPRNVSAAKVYSLLPVPAPPPAMRLRVMTCFTDPELVSYRMLVAGKVSGFDELGFPGEDAVVPSVQRRRRGKVWAGPAAAAMAVAVLVAAVFAITRFGGFDTAVRSVSSASSGRPLAPAVPAVSQQPSPASPAVATRGPARRGTPRAAAELVSTPGAGAPTRLFLRASASPVPRRDPSPGGSGSGRPAGRLRVSPATLTLGTGSSGQITLTASGGPVRWSAATASPALTLSSDGGSLSAGQQVVVTVTVSRTQDPAGQGTVTFGPGSETVTVSWSSPASSSPPPPTTSPSPTPDPSSSSGSPAATPSPTPNPSPVVTSPAMR